MQAARQLLHVQAAWWRPVLGARGFQQGCASLQGPESSVPVLLVEYCVSCNYKPRFDLLKQRVQREFPALAIKEDTQDHRAGAFEVALHQGDSVTELWSKMLTGEPSTLEATEAVAELVVQELQRFVPRTQQLQPGS